MSKYSICITHYNNASTLRKSLESILNQIDEQFEVIVVDNRSNDGSERILQEYVEKGKIKLITKKCSRGKGRQIGFENSSGEYIISNLDMDDIYWPKLSQLLNFYHESCEGSLLRIVPGVITIAPQKILTMLGGWHDLQYDEDRDLLSRAAKAGLYRWTIFPLLRAITSHPERRSLLGKLRHRYITYRERIRIGRKIFADKEPTSVKQKLIALVAMVGALFYESYKDSFNITFLHLDSRYFIPSGFQPYDVEILKRRLK